MAAFTVIEHDELSSSTATWASGTFATTYDHLYIVMSARTDYTASYSPGTMWQFNGDTGSNYSFTDLQANTGTPGTYQSSGTSIGYPPISTSLATADTFGFITAWIPNYANTSNFKQILFSASAENASSTDSQWALKVTAGLWSSTSALTSFSVTNNGGGDFVQYSSYTVYGVTGA